VGLEAWTPSGLYIQAIPAGEHQQEDDELAEAVVVAAR
jgi:hypothetical protein